MAVISAINFLESNIEFPDDMIFGEVIFSRNIWTVEWHHLINQIPVGDDYLCVQVNPFTYDVASFSMKWTDITINEKPLPQGFTPIHRIDQEHKICPDGIDLEWTSISTVDNEKYLLSWKVRTEDGFIWLDAKSGKLIKTSMYLYPNYATSCYALFDEDNVYAEAAGHETTEYVYDIFEDRYGSFYTNLLEDPTTKNAWVGASSCKAFFSVGHGQYLSTTNRIQVDSDSYVYPSDITTYSSRKFVYLLHCYSGYIASTQANSIGWQFVWKSKNIWLDGEKFYLNAFVGFDSTVDKYYGSHFTDKFFYSLDNGGTVATARSFASSYYPTIGAKCVIYGNLGITVHCKLYKVGHQPVRPGTTPDLGSCT